MQTHLHIPEWHVLKVRMEHLIHDPRFWAVSVLVVLFGLVILTTIIAKPGGGTGSIPTGLPYYPYYMP
jgi:fumarate reductase subunit D